MTSTTLTFFGALRAQNSSRFTSPPKKGKIGLNQMASTTTTQYTHTQLHYTHSNELNQGGKSSWWDVLWDTLQLKTQCNDRV